MFKLVFKDFAEAANTAQKAASIYSIAIKITRVKGGFSVGVPYSFELDEPEDEFILEHIEEDYTDPEELYWETKNRSSDNRPYDVDLERSLRYEFEYCCSQSDSSCDYGGESENYNSEFWSEQDELNNELSDYADSLARSEEDGWYYDDGEDGAH